MTVQTKCDGGARRTRTLNNSSQLSRMS